MDTPPQNLQWSIDLTATAFTVFEDGQAMGWGLTMSEYCRNSAFSCAYAGTMIWSRALTPSPAAGSINDFAIH